MPTAPEPLVALRAALAGNRFLTGPAPSSPPVVDVVVPLHNAPDESAACLRSVAEHTRVPFRLAVIDDGSTDAHISQLLAVVREAAPAVIVIERRDNRGFVRTANEGFALSMASDVVLLNADTQVSARWLEKLMHAARRRPNVATVTPLTNNGTICSIPEPLVDNALPPGYDVDRFATLVETTSLGLFPEAPTGVGFCMLLTRRALDVVGPFDADTFERGYGEENDFCQRALAAGFVNLIADDTFVYHRGRASFADAAADRIATNLARVARRYPRYLDDVARFCRQHPLAPFHAYLRASIQAGRAGGDAVRARVLHVLHEGGGTEKHARELAAMDDPGVVGYVLRSDGAAFDVDEYVAGRRLRSLRFPLAGTIGTDALVRNQAYRDALGTVCWALDVDLIHVHHLMHHTLDIADVAAAHGIPYVMTLHDYFTLCPMYTLLDPNGQPCGACVGRADATADACMAAVGRPAGHLADYQARMHTFLHGTAALFAPNPSVRDLVGARYPALRERITVIEHGHRHLPSTAELTPSRASIPPLHVAVIGALEPHKGAQVFRELLAANRRDDVVFHLYGRTTDAELERLAGSRFVSHGPYEADTIVRTLRADGIHVGLQLSIWPETFSYTLSELVAAGIPVIAGDAGAPGERIRRCRLGWTVPDIRDPAATLAILDTIMATPGLLADVGGRMDRAQALTPIETMWRRYAAIYDEIRRGRIAMDEAPSKGYVAWLGMRLAEEAERTERRQREIDLEAQLASARARLQSPRHRIAEVAGNAVQKFPLVWPVVRTVTEAVQRWEARRR